MKGLFIPEITAEMFRNGCLESIEALMAEGEIYDIDYEAEPHWIPVSDRLPEKDGYYLVSEDDGGIEVEWYDNTGWGYCGVIAWMPLPPIYHGITSK